MRTLKSISLHAKYSFTVYKVKNTIIGVKKKLCSLIFNLINANGFPSKQSSKPHTELALHCQQSWGGMGECYCTCVTVIHNHFVSPRRINSQQSLPAPGLSLLSVWLQGESSSSAISPASLSASGTTCSLAGWDTCDLCTASLSSSETDCSHSRLKILWRCCLLTMRPASPHGLRCWHARKWLPLCLAAAKTL